MPKSAPGRRSARTATREEPLVATRSDGPALVPLSELAAGRAARLDRRDLNEGEACLLAAMGLTLGSRLVVRSSGDPCIVEVRSTRIGLARSVASRLLVKDDAPVGEPGA